MPILVIVHDEDLLDTYVAESNEVVARTNILVVIRAVLKYPIQHAIVWPDVPHENLPLREGQRCRMKFVRYPTPEECTMQYNDGLRRALREALEHAAPCEKPILERHSRGDFHGERHLVSW